MSTAPASEQFLTAIQAAPDDDAPRLVYADWLQRRGDVRGEFIAIQCTLAATAEDPDDDARADLQARQWQLFDAHAPTWLAELGLEGEEGVFRRGFVEEVNVSDARLQAVHEQLGQRAVVRSLWIFPRPDGSSLGHVSSRALFSWPWLRLLRELNLAENYLGFEAVQMLAGSPHLANLEKLDLESNYVWTEGARAIAASPYFTKLRSLRLGHNTIEAPGVDAIARSPALVNLTSLELEDNILADVGARVLAGARHLTKLRELGLARNLLNHVPELTRSRTLDSLRSLDLRDNPLDVHSRAVLGRHFGKRVHL
jgi:uncharacterized protein (TIGR02996 family)